MARGSQESIGGIYDKALNARAIFPIRKSTASYSTDSVDEQDF